jgi:mRNA interferase MazF
LKQYEIRWADMPKPIGRRPVLLLSRTPAIKYLNKIIVAQVTTTIRNIPQEISVGTPEGLTRPSVVNFDNLHVVAKSRLGELVGILEPGRIVEIKRALGYALDWPELKLLH